MLGAQYNQQPSGDCVACAPAAAPKGTLVFPAVARGTWERWPPPEAGHLSSPFPS